MTVLYSVLALIVTLGILVTVHEYGHYWVARRCGVKVLRFSVGFGKILWSRTDKNGTEFAIAAIPLGGYVKMLDEREGPVADEFLDQSFNRKTVWQRMAIVLAGPAANILFAIFAYWIMFMVGVSQVKPVIGELAPEGIAANSGLQSNQLITAVDGHAVEGWQQVNFQLLSRIGETGEIEISVGDQSYLLAIEKWLGDAEQPSPLTDLGIQPYRPQVPALLAELQDGKAAKQAGLLPGDLIEKVNNVAIKQWYDFVEIVQSSAGKPLSIQILRNQQALELTLIPGTRNLDNGNTVGFVGAMVQPPVIPDDFITTLRYNPFTALLMGAEKTWNMSVVTLESIGKMVQGLLSIKNLSGPITIAKVANDSAQAGFEAFVGFLAYISIMLAIVNLLPIPVLDGGHFLFYAIEAIKGSPVSERIQVMGMKLGMSMMLMIMVVAMFNDVSRL
jgi:regulator of sigma E protease